MLGEIFVGLIYCFDRFLESFARLIESFDCQLLTDSFVFRWKCLFRSLWCLGARESRLRFARCRARSQSGARILRIFRRIWQVFALLGRILRLGLFHVLCADRLLVVVLLRALGAALAHDGLGRLLRLVGLDDIV